jgi:two-component system, LytTR family, response regulator
MLRGLIIDDEMLARKRLSALLASDGRVTVVGEAGDAREAIELIKQLRPELIFLDIDMPAMDGFAMLEQLEETPYVVFTTAFSEHAAKAFDRNALDYIVKPILPDRLHSAIEKAIREITIAGMQGFQERKLGLHSKVFIKDGERIYFVTLSDIFIIRSVGNYCKICFHDKGPLLARSLAVLEERLPTDSFFRANRMEIINIHYINKMMPAASKGGLVAEMANGEKIDISLRQASKFKQWMSL